MKQLAFAVTLLGAFGFFTWTLIRRIRILARCKPEDRLDRMPDRLRSLAEFFLGQRKVVEPVSYQKKKGLTSVHHVWIFWGFLVITVGTAELILTGLVPSLDLSFIGATPYRVLKLTIDVFNLIVLAMVGFAFFRRIVIKPRLIPLSLDAAVILSAIGGLMITHFGYHAFHFVANGAVEPWAADASLAVSAHLAGALSGASPDAARVVSEINWWLHVGILLAFMNYLPYSKHVHIITAGPNIFTRKLTQRGILPKLNLEVEDLSEIGIVADYKDFTWKSMLDNFSCTECGRCSNFCPAFNTEKPLSPMHLVHDIKHEALERGTLESRLEDLKKAGKNGEAAAKIQAQLDAMEPLVGGRIKAETLWACTTCGACQEVCPVFIDHPEKILLMRQNLVMLQEETPADLARTFKNLERNNNPWGIAADKRMDWAEAVEGGVPTIDEKPNAEYLLWIGCAGAFDDRIKKSTVALVEALKEAEVDFAVLGLEEGCTGDPARRAGNEMLYQMQAQQNVETMNNYKVRKVITACPHCLHTIKNEYPQLGGNYETYHHTQILRQLVESGRLNLQNPVARNMTYHDPCYLGRWNGEYDAPRALLEAAPISGGLVELDRNKQHGFCCGGGGGRMWQEEHIGKRVNRDRVAEILDKGVEAVAVACPFCTIMVEDGLKDANAEERVQVVDVAQVIAKSMRRKHKGAHPVPEPAQDEASA